MSRSIAPVHLVDESGKLLVGLYYDDLYVKYADRFAMICNTQDRRIFDTMILNMFHKQIGWGNESLIRSLRGTAHTLCALNVDDIFRLPYPLALEFYIENPRRGGDLCSYRRDGLETKALAYFLAQRHPLHGTIWGTDEVTVSKRAADCGAVWSGNVKKVTIPSSAFTP